MEQSLFINGVHAVLAVAGFSSIAWLARTRGETRWFWPTTLAICAIMAGFLFFVSDPGVIFEDFRKAYYVAGKASVVSREEIAQLFQSGVFGFVNLPILAYAFAPFSLFEERVAGLVYSVIAGIALLGGWLVICRELNFTRAQQACSLFALAAFGPLIHSVRQANTTHVTLAAALWAAFALKRGRPMLSGAILGVAAMVKPPLALFGLYFLVRRHWAAAAAMATTGIAIIACSLFILGLETHISWYEACLRPFTTGVVGAFNAQSIPAFFARFEHDVDVFWDWNSYPVSDLVRFEQYVASLVLVGMAVWTALRAGGRDLALEFTLVLALAFLLSSLSWSHYAVWLLPALAVLFVRTSVGGPTRHLRPALIAAFVLTAPAQFLSDAMRAGHYPMPHLLVSHLVLGGVVVLVLLALTTQPATSRAGAA